MTTTEMGRVHVFVMEPRGEPRENPTFYTFPWEWNKWKLEPRLIPLSDLGRARSMGTASFQLLRKIRYEPEQRRNAHLLHTDGVIAGCWVCIAAGELSTILTGADLDPNAVLWWGWIAQIDTIPVLIDSQSDAVGSVTALEVGHLLDSVQIKGWRQQPKSDAQYPESINSPPTANIATKGGPVIGNMIAVEDIDGNNNPGHVFIRLGENCSTDAAKIATRWRLLRHMTIACRPGALPPLNVTCADASEATDPAWNPGTPTIAGYLNDTTGPEIYDLRELTLKGALDLLIPDTHDLDYRIDLGRTAWTIRVATVSTDSTYELPAATPTNVTLDATCQEFKIGDSAADVPDEVVFEGGPHIFGVSAGHMDENWDKKYSSFQQAIYEDADPETRRSSPELEGTFTLFGVIPNDNGDLRRALEPGESPAGVLPMCPEVGWSGSAADAEDRIVRIGKRWTELTQQWNDSSASFSPYLPSATLLQTVPWPLGLQSDGSDFRNDEMRAHPVYMKPKVFNYDPSLDAADQWFDLTAKKNPLTSASQLINENPQVDVDDGTPALRIAFNVPHRLALGTFDEDADDDGVPPDIDWRKFVVTFAIASDQRLRIVKRRKISQPTQPNPNAMADLPDHRVRRSVVVRDDRYQFWAVLLGTVLGVKNDGGTAVPDRLTHSNELDEEGNELGESGGQAYITRNDFPAAEKYVRRLATWAFRPRNPVHISLIRPDAPPAWAKIGVVLGTITDRDSKGKAVPFTSNTIIREIRRTWGASPRLDISTEMLSQPKPASPSPSSGGAVSVANGGTLAQGVARLRSEVAKLQEGTQRQMIHPGSSPGAAAATFRDVEITGGKALGYGGLTGIKWTGTPIVTLSGTYDPNAVGTATDDGVGWGTDLTTGELLLIVNAPVEDALGNYLSGGGAIDSDLPNTTRIRVMDSILIPDGSATEKTFWRAHEMGAS